MTSLPRILSLLSALTATSYALSCTQCKSVFSSSCSGDKVTCPFGSFCGSTYIEIIVGEIPIALFIRDCIVSSSCDLKGSMSLQYRQIKRVTSCCDTDNCTPTISTLPAESSQPNGLFCQTNAPSGFLDWFFNSNTIQCRGDENVCILQNTKVTGPMLISTSIRACGTRDLCDIHDLFFDFVGVSVEVQFVCSKDEF